MADPTWDDFDAEEEQVTKEEAKEIEKGNTKVPIGLYLCKVVETKPKQMDFKAYSVMGVNIKYRVEKVIEVAQRKPTSDEVELLTGKFLYDDVSFASTHEEEWSVKRRKSIALKLRLIGPGETLKKEHWRDAVYKNVIVRVVDNSYQKKDKVTGELGAWVQGTKIGFFDGYEFAEEAEVVTEKAEEWDDI